MTTFCTLLASCCLALAVTLYGSGLPLLAGVAAGVALFYYRASFPRRP